jgi:hypothetical protein
MADTRVQVEVEDWVRENWMPEKFGRKFYQNRLKLSSGGVFAFDAVSEDKTIAACISTSAEKTSGGKLAVGKMMKLRSDMLFLHLATGVEKRLIVLTEEGMFAHCEKEKKGGRVPLDIEFVLASIPADLRTRLAEARKAASREVTPREVEQLPDELLLGEGPGNDPT